MSHTEHKKLSPAVAHCYILTVSDTRTLATDESGRTICDLLWAEGHQVNGRKVVRDEPDQVREAI
jgi:molybdenum cofactor biosynthesis protein B